MSLPTLSKTWQYDVNKAYAATGTLLTDNRNWLFGLKNSLITFAQNPWQVRGSSDSSTAALLAVGAAGPGTDKWASTSNLVWQGAGSAHSWIVLRQPQIYTSFEILISLEPFWADGRAGSLWVSPGAGFTGGTTTARPTATDEINLWSNGEWGGLNTDLNLKLHVMQSTDGQCTRWWTYVNGVPLSIAIFDKPQNPVSGWTNPSVSCWRALNNGGSAQPTIANLYSSGNPYFFGRGTATMSMFPTCESYISGNIPTQVNQTNDLSGTYQMFPIGLVSATAGNKGRHCNLFDIWWGNPALNESDNLPSDGSRQFVLVGDLWMPWNGTVMQTT